MWCFGTAAVPHIGLCLPFEGASAPFAAAAAMTQPSAAWLQLRYNGVFCPKRKHIASSGISGLP